MAYGDIETSAYGGEPIELIRFDAGVAPEDVFCYTNAEKTFVYQNDVYEPVAVTHDEIKTSGDFNAADFSITMQLNTEVAEIFRVYPPAYVVTVTIMEGHANDPDLDFRVKYVGRVLNCSRDGSEVVLSCESTITSLQRPALRRNYQRMCPHALYGPECRAPKTPFNVSVVELQAYNVIVLSDPGVPWSQFMGGTIEHTGPTGRREIFQILEMSGSGAVRLGGTPIYLEVGGVVSLFRGCDHTMGAGGCAMHDNILNYGGQPWIPLKNPMGNTSPFG